MRSAIPRTVSPAASRSQSVQRTLLTISAVVESVAGLGLIVAPGPTSSLILGRQPGPAGTTIGRVTGLAVGVLGVACCSAHADTDRGARSCTLRAFTLYDAGAGLSLVFLGATGKARGLVVWSAGLLRLGLAGAFVGSLLEPPPPARE